MSPRTAIDSVKQASELHNAGRIAEAEAVLAPVLLAEPARADAHHLLALIRLARGDAEGCERGLREALRLQPHASAARTLSRLLLGQGRADEAVEVQAAFARRCASPQSRVELASTLLQAGRDGEAEAVLREAADAGAPVEGGLELGRLLLRQRRLDGAEAAFRAALAGDPGFVAAHRELAQLVWMRTGDVQAARGALDSAPPGPDLTAVLVRLLSDAGEERQAYAVAAAAAARWPVLHLLAARAAVTVDAGSAERHLAQVPRGRRDHGWAKAVIETDLALGRAASAALRAEAVHRERPGDPYATALLGTAWRLAGDGRAASFAASARTVAGYHIDPPPGWSDLPGYLHDLGEALEAIHAELHHPIGQSVRGGSQTLRSLKDYPHPPIRALFAAIDPPIRRHLAGLGRPDGYRITGAWSVRLRRRGRHIDHVHAEGGLSSAFHVRVPEGLAGRQGWLHFGRPGTPTLPPLAPEHALAPQPGVLVLFPSAMWHGTEPFEADGVRLSCAFDIAPA